MKQLSASSLPAKTNDTTEAHEIISSSEGLGWKGVHVLRGRSMGYAADNIAVPFHTFSLVTGDPYTVEIKKGSRFVKHTNRRGNIFVNPANNPVTARTSDAKSYVTVALDPNRLVEPASGMPLSSDTAFRMLPGARDHQLKALIEALIAEAEAGNPGGSLLVDALTTALAVHFAANYAQAPQAALRHLDTGLTRQQLRRATEYMEANIAASVSLEDIAKEVGLSKYHFSRQFKQSTGATPYQFLMTRKMDKARALLETGENPITDIAHQLNFSDQSHFNRAFKKRFGLSPRAFLNQ